MQRYFGTRKKENEFLLNDDDLRHIKVVMRMKNMDEIIVVNDELSYLCYIDNIETNIRIIEKKLLDSNSKTIPYTCLIIPVLKEQKMDYILQKATELGVLEIIPYYAERGIIKEKENCDKKIVRWQKIIKEASEQTHRNNIPIISNIKRLDDIKVEGINIVCSTAKNLANIKNILKTINKCDRINIVIGPEGGISTNEEQKLIENSFIPITLGNQILRVETVPLFVMSTINYEFMEW